MSVCLYVRYARANRCTDPDQTWHERTFGAGDGYRPVKLWVGVPKNAWGPKKKKTKKIGLKNETRQAEN